MKVWRVEHGTLSARRGCPSGPYQGDRAHLSDELRNRLQEMGYAHSDESHLPPYADPLLGYIDYGEFCGLASRAELDNWFDGWHETLEATGFMVSVYDVPARSVRKGKDGQVVFKIKDATRVGAEMWGVFA